MTRAFHPWGFAAICLGLWALLASSPSEPAEPERASGHNRIEAVSFGDAGVEIRLQSSRPFPVRALPPRLRIGAATFDRSRRPRDGDLHRLIFLLPPAAYARLNHGAPMQVDYGQGGSPKQRWDFGAFTKKRPKHKHKRQ